MCLNHLSWIDHLVCLNHLSWIDSGLTSVGDFQSVIKMILLSAPTLSLPDVKLNGSTGSLASSGSDKDSVKEKTHKR